MSVVVLCYPSISPEHQRFIDDVRSEHDLIFKDVVRPHFTMVFPVRDVATSEFHAHIRHVARSWLPFRFVCRHAMVHHDDANDNWYVFFVPDEGFSSVARLHDELYVGVLASRLRLDLPYVPHIGVATHKNAAVCKQLADRLNRDTFEIDGMIHTLTISEYDGSKVTDLHQIPLGNAAG